MATGSCVPRQKNMSTVQSVQRSGLSAERDSARAAGAPGLITTAAAAGGGPPATTAGRHTATACQRGPRAAPAAPRWRADHRHHPAGEPDSLVLYISWNRSLHLGCKVHHKQGGLSEPIAISLLSGVKKCHMNIWCR